MYIYVSYTCVHIYIHRGKSRPICVRVYEQRTQEAGLQLQGFFESFMSI